MHRALQRLNIESAVYGPGFDTTEDVFKSAHVILLMENYWKTPWFLPTLQKYKNIYTVFWSIDGHLNSTFKRHCDIVYNNKINMVLNSTKSMVNKFAVTRKGSLQHSLWFPNCYPSDLINKEKIDKCINVGFCGNVIRDRKAWLRSLNIQPDIMVLGMNMVRRINQYWIHWNKNYSIDINYRTFETLGCGTFLLTNETDALSSLFKIGTDLITYNSIEDCKKKINYYINNKAELNYISSNGYHTVRKEHTYDNRAKLLLNYLDGNV